MAIRRVMSDWRQTEPALILCAVRWYLRYSLSLRDVEELLQERGLNADHTTVWRWVQRYGPRIGSADAPSSQADQQVLTRRRNVCSREGALVLLVSGD